MYVKKYLNLEDYICETSYTVLNDSELENARLMNFIKEYDKPLVEWLSNLGIKYKKCADSGWIETTDHTKTILHCTKGSLEEQLWQVLDWVTNPSTRIPSQDERDRQYEEFGKGLINMLERVFEIVDGE